MSSFVRSSVATVSTMSSKPKEAVDIVFDGKKLANWFIYDRQVLRFMRKKYGIIGEQIWLGTSIPIETATVDAD